MKLTSRTAACTTRAEIEKENEGNQQQLQSLEDEEKIVRAREKQKEAVLGDIRNLI